MKCKVILLFVVLLGLSGCLSSSLTRGKAKDVIEDSDNYKAKLCAIPLAKSEVDDCVRQGYLEWKRSIIGWNLSVTEKGKKFFVGAGGQVDDVGVQWQGFSVTPAVPMKPHVIEVTGITDGDNGSKIVEYQWDWNFKGQPQEVRDLIFKQNPANSGKAAFKLYDNSWRVVEFK